MAGESYTVTFSVTGSSATVSLIVNVFSADSIYQKLAYGTDVNILIVGDSIAYGLGVTETERKWTNQLINYLTETYYQDGTESVFMNNVAISGYDAYETYISIMMLDDVDYDLAIICEGHNDRGTDFSLYYESIIYAIQQKYPTCSIISILEASQKTYTTNIKTIQEICEHYGIPTADTLESFANSGYEESELMPDGIHPQGVGLDLYFQTVRDVIDAKVSEKAETESRTTILDSYVTVFNNTEFYPASNFTKEDSTTFSIKMSKTGVLGIKSNSTPTVYVDDVETTTTYKNRGRTWVAIEKCSIGDKLKLVFSDSTYASGFSGIYFSWE